MNKQTFATISLLHFMFFVLFYYFTTIFNSFLTGYLELHGADIQAFVGAKMFTVILLILLFILAPFLLYVFIKFAIIKQLVKVKFKGWIFLNLKLFAVFALVTFIWCFFVYGLKTKMFIYLVGISGVLILLAFNYLANTAHFLFAKNKPMKDLVKLLKWKRIAHLFFIDIAVIGGCLLLFILGGFGFQKLYVSRYSITQLGMDKYTLIFGIVLFLGIIFILTLNNTFFKKLVGKA